VNNGHPGARDAKITGLPVALPCMSIAKSRLSVRSYTHTISTLWGGNEASTFAATTAGKSAPASSALAQ
jgi:hypothetical protein